MFSDSKYTRWYYLLVEKAKFRNNLSKPFDRHHVIPKSLGGSNKKENLIKLTPREHYVAHLLLFKITSGKNRSKMAFALFRFSPRGSNRYGNSRTYERFRKEVSSVMAGKNNPFYGRTLTEEHRRKISGKNSGMYGKSNYSIWVEEYGVEEANSRYNKWYENKLKKLKFGSDNPAYGKPRTNEQKKNHSKRMSGLGNPRYGKKLFWIQKEDKSIQVELESLEEYLEKGWIRGRGRVDFKKRIWVMKGLQSKLIDVIELKTYESNGWVKGRIRGHKSQSLHPSI